MNFFTNINVKISIIIVAAFVLFITVSGKFEYKTHGEDTEVSLSFDVNKK